MEEPKSITQAGEILPLEGWMIPACAAIAQTAPDPWRVEDFAPVLQRENRLCLVALQQGEPAGFACFLTLYETADLQLVAVAPAHRGQGVATALLQASVPLLQGQGVAQVLLEVRSENQPAIALYEKLGFRLLARRAEMYQNPPEDGFLMRLTL